MNGVCHRYLISQNVFIFYQKRNVSSISASYLTSRNVHNVTNNWKPVKLSYASYESMKGVKDNSKQPVMIMHGLFGSKNNWNSLSKTIHQQTDRKVITVDARNHGDSPHSVEMSYPHMAQDVVQLMSDLGFEKSVLIGHSMGGSAMMYTALHYPQFVEKLIVVDMSPVRTSPSLKEMKKIFEVMRTVRLTGSTTLTKAREIADQHLATVIKPQALRQFLVMNLVEADVGKFRWRVNLPVLEQHFEHDIATFPHVEGKVYMGPTLFVGGSNSDYIRVEDHTRIKQLFPLAEFMYVNGANHWVHADKPTEFLRIVINFINKSHT